MSSKEKKATATASAEQTGSKVFYEKLSFVAKEQYKMLRTNLNFVLPEVPENGKKCMTIGVSSSVRGEGKSTTSLNLAYALAEDGKQVLLIDADLRLPSIAKTLNNKNTFGLSDLLHGEDPKQTGVFKTNIHENCYIMFSGAIPPNPSELLGSARMKRILDEYSQYFDFIILDLPPVNIVTDTMTVSKFLDGLILVVREEYTGKPELKECVRKLELSNVNVLGIVLNGVDSEEGGGHYKRYGKYGKYGYRYGKYAKYKYYKAGYDYYASAAQSQQQEKKQ